ncbi:MAG: diaminopimelate epimerase [Propionibacteriaceae bacterium]|jgi:diaminopimelate epimerase|nr:diaminopimelate epimerase [Propionibacteriaceae bacterium]
MHLEFTKGQGAGNDFVILLDPHGDLELSDELIRKLCDRRFGIGADGVLHAVLGDYAEEWDGPEWFMDYRNADGSIAEMCGNGLRVFCKFLFENHRVPGHSVAVGTRAGLRTGQEFEDGSIEVSMGEAKLGQEVQIDAGGQAYQALAVDVGNPHAVSYVSSVLAVDLSSAPTWLPETAFPAGVNTEFVERTAPGKLNFRVFERGSGETLACGTGVVAAAAIEHESLPEDQSVTVETPGGTLQVRFADGQAYLKGPAELVFSGMWHD